MRKKTRQDTRVLLCAGLLSLGACGIDAPKAPDIGGVPINANPRAIAGHGGDYVVGHEVQLDGSSSFDLDGEIQSYAWEMIESPFGSESFEGSGSPGLSYYLSTVGEYVFQLTVTDDQGATDTGLVEVLAVLHDPISITIEGTDRIELGQSLPLVAALDLGDATDVSLEWSVVMQPDGASVVIDGATTATPSFRPDSIGMYSVELVVETPWDSFSATTDIFVTADQTLLLHAVREAKFSREFNRIVYRSTDQVFLEGFHIHVVDMGTGTEDLVQSFFPFHFDISPDGTQIALNHRAPGSNVRNAISTADIVATDQIQSFVIGRDVVPNMVSNTRVLLIGAGGIRDLDTTTGTVAIELEGTLLTGIRFTNTQAATIYSFGDSSADDSGINTIDISTSPMQILSNSSSVGSLAVCGDLWPSADGEFVITGCGEVLQVSGDPLLHLTNQATLPVTQIRQVSHGTSSGRIVVIHGPSHDIEIELFDDSTFASLGVLTVPPVLHPTSTGEFSALFPSRAFFSPDETELYVIGPYEFQSDTLGGIVRIPID